MGWLLPAAIGLGGELIGSLAGGGGGSKPSAPKWLIDLIMNEYKTDRSSGYLPDRALFEKAIQSNIDEIMASLPVATEEFNAGLAARGIYSAGEAPKALYGDVIAPVARAATGAVIQGQLGYAEAYQRGQMFEQQRKTEVLNALISAVLAREPKPPTALQRAAGVFGSGVSDIASLYAFSGLLKG